MDNQTQVLPGNKPPQYLFGSQQSLRWHELLSSPLIGEKPKATEFGNPESSCCSADIHVLEGLGRRRREACLGGKVEWGGVGTS